MSGADFRRYLYDPDDPRIAELKGLDAYAYREVAKADAFTGDLIRGWTPLYLAAFRGVTEDGALREGLYPLTPARPDERAPVEEMIATAKDLLNALDPPARDRVS